MLLISLVGRIRIDLDHLRDRVGVRGHGGFRLKSKRPEPHLLHFFSRLNGLRHPLADCFVANRFDDAHRLAIRAALRLVLHDETRHSCVHATTFTTAARIDDADEHGVEHLLTVFRNEALFYGGVATPDGSYLLTEFRMNVICQRLPPGA